MVMFWCLYSCGGAGLKSDVASYTKISSEQAMQMMKSTQNYILLDVRTEQEYKEQRIPGSLLLPDYEIIQRAEEMLPDKNATILIYCRSGRRSAIVGQQLVDMGYTNVYDFGGIIDWEYDMVSDYGY